MRKHGFFIGLVSLLAVIAVFYAYRAYFSARATNKEKVAVVAVEAAKVIVSDVPDHIQSTGTLQANQHVDIIPEYAGVIAKILFLNGQYVTANQPLIQLDDIDANAQLKSANAHLMLSEAKYKRSLSLAKRKAISQQNFDEAKANLQQQQALVKEKQNKVDKMLLRAPFAGQITRRQVDLGQYVNRGQQLVELVDNSQLKVTYQVAEQQTALLKDGQQVTLTTSAYPHQIFSGKVDYISPQLATQTRTVEVQAVIPNPQDLLKPGMFVNVEQLLAVRPHMPIVPIQALIATLGGNYVYRIVGGKAVETQVRVGQRWRANAEVLSGLKEGEEIVLAGQQKLRDGMAVQISKEDIIELPTELQ